MKARILIPPLIASVLLSAMLGTLLGGSPWLWLGLAWVAAVPLTLVWVRVMEMWSRADLRAPQVTHRSIARRTDDR